MPNPTAELTQEELDLKLSQEAKTEYEAAKTIKKEPWKEAMEEDHPELKEQAEEPKEEKEESDAKPEETKEVVEEVKASEEKPGEVDKTLQEWQVKHNFQTIEEAKEDLEKTKAVVGKYQSPEEMARALRLIQSERDKLKNDTSKQEQPVITPAVQKDPRLEINQYVATNAEKLLDEYKRLYPAKSNVLTDEAILEDIADRYYGQFQSWAREQQSVVKRNAESKRDEVLNTLSAEDKQFIPEIKPILLQLSDEQVLSKQFDIQDIVAYARGKNMQRLISEAEERGYKRAKNEGSKIVAQIPQGKTESKSIVKKPSGTVSLSNYDKERALEMYEGTTLTEEEKYQAFAELKKSRADKNK